MRWARNAKAESRKRLVELYSEKPNIKKIEVAIEKAISIGETSCTVQFKRYYDPYYEFAHRQIVSDGELRYLRYMEYQVEVPSDDNSKEYYEYHISF